MSEETPYRYTAALAQEIEVGWQERWDAEGTFEAPNPAGPLADARGVAAPAQARTCSTCSRTPAAPACTSATRWATSRTDVSPATTACRAATSCTPGLRRLRAARRAVRRADRAAPPRVRPRRNIVNMRRQLRRLGLGYDERRSYRDDRPGVLPLDPVDLPADLRRVVRPRAAADGGRGRSASWRPRSRRRRGTAPARAAGRLGRPRPRPSARRARRHRLAYTRRGAGQLVPGAGHGAGERGGHRRRPLRARQLPGLPAQPAASG